MVPKITASIVIFKNIPEPLEDLVRILCEQCDVTYIVDNSPVSLTWPNLRPYPNLRVIRRPDNPGYGIGHNCAIQEAMALGSDYHLVVNPDIRINYDFLPKTIAFMEQHSSLGAVMPKVLYDSGREQSLAREIPAPLNLVIRRLFLSRIWEPLNRSYLLKRYASHSYFLAPVISGCCMLIRSDILKRVGGGFDKRFFMYFEDYDLSRRIASVSHVAVWRKVEVYHGYQRESLHSWAHMCMHLQGMIRYFNKWGWFFDRQRKRLNSQYQEENRANLYNSIIGIPREERVS